MLMYYAQFDIIQDSPLLVHSPGWNFAFDITHVHITIQDLNQELETECPKLVLNLTYLGVLFFSRETTIYSNTTM